MKLPKSVLKIEFMRGTGPGGQHRNKTESACRITHVPTGISAYCDERSQHVSKKKALKDLETKLKKAKMQRAAELKKSARDEKIHNMRIVRTYHIPRGEVKDHRTGKVASTKDVLGKGKLELLR